MDAAADRGALVTTRPGFERSATVPFVGLVEAFVLTALRSAGFPMAKIRRAVGRVTDELGVADALASQRMLADGLRSSPLSPTASTHGAPPAVGATRSRGASEGGLSCITYGSDGWTEQLRLPVYEHAEVIVARTEPSATLLVHGGARVEDLVERFKVGNSVGE